MPSDDEWCILTTFIDQTVDCYATGYSGTDAGYKMKNKSGWNSGGNGNDLFGFSGLPGGLRNEIGFFSGVGNNGFWWTSTAIGNTESWERYLSESTSKVHRDIYDKGYGFSVRCVKD